MRTATVIVFTAITISITHGNEEELTGLRQSPINIDTDLLEPLELGDLEWSSGYKLLPKEIFLEKRRHSIMLVVHPSAPLRLSGGILKTTYEFANIHFHWGNNTNIGSEHTVDNFSYPMEMHAVHYQDSNLTLDEFAVVSWFFEIADVGTEGMDLVLEKAIEVTAYERPQPVTPFPLHSILPVDSFKYYTYHGSLTRPPYEEDVTWIIGVAPQPLSIRQYEIFLETAELDSNLLNNFRPIQELNGRTVHFVTNDAPK